MAPMKVCNTISQKMRVRKKKKGNPRRYDSRQALHNLA